ncbi:helix-turn-helix domain-containing protein [Spirillospora sp. NPDC047279]|uniref:AraC-like ligand-binding domain-containing protein n=1 Tax=Spirillospora sp. NPDC047279 TaxID=3155478 RepID=UPI00340F185B
MPTEITTADHPAEDQAEYWQHAIAEAFGPLNVRPPRRRGFSARLVARTLGPVHAGEVFAPAHAVQRTASQLSAEYYKIGLMLSGSCLLRQNDRTMLVRPGQFVLYDLSRPVQISFVAHHIFTVLVPHRAIPIPPDRVSTLTATPLDTRTGRTFTAVLTSLARDGDAVEGPHSHHLGEAIVDLMTAALSERLGRAAEPPPPDAPDLFRAVQAWIDEHLHLVDLTPAAIAQAHHLSVRQLYRIFQSRGTTVARYIRTRRLEHCRRDLRASTQPIGAVAARWGFPDAAAFSRAFRAAHGTTPSAYRDRHS